LLHKRATQRRETGRLAHTGEQPTAHHGGRLARLLLSCGGLLRHCAERRCGGGVPAFALGKLGTILEALCVPWRRRRCRRRSRRWMYPPRRRSQTTAPAWRRRRWRTLRSFSSMRGATLRERKVPERGVWWGPLCVCAADVSS
jgi:hypothetical protein